MTAFLVIVALVCILFWKVVNFALAGAIYMIHGGNSSMARCEDTARGILGSAIAILIFCAIIF